MTERAVEVWNEFCENLKRAGSVLVREAMPGDEVVAAEGIRHLVSQIQMGFNMTYEHADPSRPRLVPAYTPTLPSDGITSDCRYHHAFIDGSANHRLSGRLGSAPLVEFSVYTGKIGLDEQSRQIASLIETDLGLESDGSLEIVLSPQEQPGNWLRTDAETRYLFIREYAHDWATTEPSRLVLRREGGAAEAVRPRPSVKELEAALQRTSAFVDSSTRLWSALVDARAASEPNRFHGIPEGAGGTMPSGHQFAFGHFRLGPEEALMVEFTPGEVPYWGVQLTNCWFEALSFHEGLSCSNNRKARIDASGKVRLVVADGVGRDARVANGIDTLGHAQGSMVFRWSRSRDPVPAISTRVVKRSSLT